MRFTMARPEVSCHPELLLDGAQTVVAAALCYVADAPEPRPDEGRLPRYTWRDEYAILRERLDALGRRLGGAYRVLVDENDHVDRAAAVRAGVAFYGKNTMAITRRHGSWVVLGALVTDVEIEATRRSSSTAATAALHRRLPDRSARRAGHARRDEVPVVLDTGACADPRGVSRELGDMVYGCDICQDVCPWNRGVEKRRRGARLDDAHGHSSRSRDWLDRDGDALVGRVRPAVRPEERRALAAPERA